MDRGAGGGWSFLSVSGETGILEVIRSDGPMSMTSSFEDGDHMMCEIYALPDQTRITIFLNGMIRISRLENKGIVPRFTSEYI